MKALLLILIFMVNTSSLYAQTLEDLVFITEEYPPFNFTADETLQGISTDLLVEMLQRLDAKQTRKDIASFSWARGYNLALKQKNTVLYSTTRTAAREDLFQWVGPIIRSEIVLLARKTDNISLRNLEELNGKGLRIGVVLNDVGEQILQENDIDRKLIYRYNKGIQLAEMLQQGRIDLLAYGRQVSMWNLKKLGYDHRNFEVIFPLKKADYYFALNKNAKTQIVQQLQKALDEVKDSGALDKIIKRYLD